MPSTTTTNDSNGNHNADIDPLQDMPIATSLLNNDTIKLKNILQERVFHKATVESCSIEQTIGHAFTGGRSTPVYKIIVHIIINKRQSTTYKSKQKRKYDI